MYLRGCFIGPSPVERPEADRGSPSLVRASLVARGTFQASWVNRRCFQPTGDPLRPKEGSVRKGPCSPKEGPIRLTEGPFRPVDGLRRLTEGLLIRLKVLQADKEHPLAERGLVQDELGSSRLADGSKVR